MGRARPGALTLALVGLFVAACDYPTGDKRVKPELAPYTDDAKKLLDGLGAGDELAGWTVASVQGPHRSEITVRFRRGDVQFDAWLVRTGTAQQLPVLSTAYYDLFFGRPVPGGTPLPKEQVHRVLEQLAERVARTEGGVTPEGM